MVQIGRQLFKFGRVEIRKVCFVLGKSLRELACFLDGGQFGELFGSGGPVVLCCGSFDEFGFIQFCPESKCFAGQWLQPVLCLSIVCKISFC